MAWDLWSSSFDKVPSDGDDYYEEHSEWLSNFFGYGRDEIEEDALNEASCIQVLRILISNADSEIKELEKDLLSLQDELALTEIENWPEMCCSALTEKINRLDAALSKLKGDHAGGTEMQLLLSSKPAETLNEIVKALQRDQCCQETCNQHLDENNLNPIVNVTEHALYKDPSNINSNIIKEEGKELHGTSDNSRSPELLSELHEKGSDNPEKIKELLAVSLVRSPDLGAIICAPVHSDEMKSSETLDNVTESEDLRRSQLSTTDTDQILNLFSSKENGNISSEAKEETSILRVKDVSSDDFKATGIKSRKKHLNSRLCTAQQRKIGDSDLDKKICDFTQKTARRVFKKESKLAPDENFESTDLPLRVVHPQNLSYADTELSSFEDNNGMQTKNALYTELQLTDEEKPQAQDPKSEIAANLHKFNVSSRSKLKGQGKQKPDLEAYAARGPHDSRAEVIPSTSIAVSKKRQRKSKTCTDSATLNEFKKGKTKKRSLQPGQHETEGGRGSLVIYDPKFSELQRKRKSPVMWEIQSVRNLDMPNSDGVSNDKGNQLDLDISKSDAFVDSLKRKNVHDLRGMAKLRNVKRYYKLPKLALVHEIAEAAKE